MIYTKVDTNEDFTYTVFFTQPFYDIFEKYYTHGSYVTLLYRLFGMLPQDFYHYIGAQYHATFKPSPYVENLIYVRFKNKNDAINYANEIDRRITYCFNRGDFD